MKTVVFTPKSILSVCEEYGLPCCVPSVCVHDPPLQFLSVFPSTALLATPPCVTVSSQASLPRAMLVISEIVF